MTKPIAAARAVELFAAGFNCSQAILAAYAKQLALDEATALKLATGFGAGMGRMSDTCGAVTGAFMVLGLKHGRGTRSDVAARDKTYELVNEFAKRFKARHGSITCKRLLGYDLNKPEEFALAKQEGLFTTRCPCFVKDAALILEELESGNEAGHAEIKSDDEAVRGAVRSRKIIKALPRGTKPSDYITSLSVSARKPLERRSNHGQRRHSPQTIVPGPLPDALDFPGDGRGRGLGLVATAGGEVLQRQLQRGHHEHPHRHRPDPDDVPAPGEGEI